MKTLTVSTMVSISPKVGRIDYLRVDATTDADIASQQAEDEIESMQEVASFIRQIRHRLGLSQIEFARLISVSLNTMRNWEKGTECPVGTARKLLILIDRLPELALAALS